MSAAGGSTRYLAVWAGLVVLTVVSYGASLLALGPLEMPVAIAIAAVKATLVGLYFMHLSEQPLSVGLVALVTAAWVALLGVGVAMDVALR